MKISDIKNEEAIDLLIDCVDPAVNIFSDEKFREKLKKAETTKGKISAAKYAIKNHKKDVIELLAVLNGQAVEEYSANVFEMMVQILEIFNDENMQDFFVSLAQNSDEM